MSIDELFELDDTDPRERLAEMLVANDERLIHDLVKLRKDMGLHAKDVADRMGIDKSGVSRIESGARDVQFSTLRRYAMAIDAVIKHEVVCFSDVDAANKARRYYESGRRFSQTESVRARSAVRPLEDRAVSYGKSGVPHD